MTRVWKTPVLVLATAYFVFDALFSYVTRPVAAWLGKVQLFARTRRWIVSLRPYPSLALFAVPLIILEPAKPLAGYLAATGHFWEGATTFVVAEVLKLLFVERLFQLNREKLLSIPAFASGYKYWRRMMDVVENLEIWKTARWLADNAARYFRTRWLQFKRAQGWYRFQQRTLRYAESRNRR